MFFGSQVCPNFTYCAPRRPFKSVVPNCTISVSQQNPSPRPDCIASIWILKSRTISGNYYVRRGGSDSIFFLVCVGDLHRLENGGEEGKLQPCLSRRRSRSVRTLWYLVLFTSCRSSYCFFSVCRMMMWPSVFTLLYSLTLKACANSRRRHVILSMLLRGSNVSKIPQPVFPGVFLSFFLFLSRSSVRIQTRRPVCTTTSMHSYGVGCNTGLQCR